MKREVYDCDGCGATNIGPSHYVIPLGRRTDAAGSSETTTAEFDLCQTCRARAFSFLAGHMHATNVWHLLVNAVKGWKDKFHDDRRP